MGGGESEGDTDYGSAPVGREDGPVEVEEGDIHR